jgi:putative protease
MERPELMSPIKSRAGLAACKDYADAVYFGLSQFNLRANSKGITLDNLKEVVADCHREGIKAYVTVNSTLYNQDLVKAKELVKKIKEANADAVIVWDPAVIEIAKKVGIDFFISTQANVSNWRAADFYSSLGTKRVIAAREMSLEQIKKTKKNVKNLEVEAFVHGAMCLAISGRCILSGFYEGKSANRGSCNQICRRKFKLINDQKQVVETDGSYYLSPKDICMIEYIPELIEAGIDSFKIEGRQRSTKYVHETAKYYRKAIDAYFDGTFSRKEAKKWKKELGKVYNRGFSTGFYFGTPGKEGINFESSGNAGSTKRLQLGKVVHYYPQVEVASINLIHNNLEIGDQILIEGETTYLEGEVESIEKNGKQIKKAKKGEEVGIKVLERVRKNDRVFLIRE